MTLLDKLADPKILETMSTGEKFSAALQVTILGMGITFGALVILWVFLSIMAKTLQSIEKSNDDIQVVKDQPVIADDSENFTMIEEDDEINEEIVAAITAAIASSLDTSIHNIVVRDIVRAGDNVPAWGQAGRIDQINTRL